MAIIKLTRNSDSTFFGEFAGENSRMPKATLIYSETLGGFVGVDQPANGRYLKPLTNIDMLAVMMQEGQSMQIDIEVKSA